MSETKSFTVARVITSPEVVHFHLKNTLHLSDGKYKNIIIGQNVSQHRHLYPNMEWIDLPITRDISFFKDVLTLFRLIHILRKIKPDILHSIMPKSGLMAALAGYIARVPVRIHTFTGQVWAHKSGLSRGLLIFFDKVIVCLNTICLTDSLSQSDFLFEHGIKKEGRPLPVIHRGSLSGVDLETFSLQEKPLWRKKIREQYHIPENAFVFMFLGRKCRDKGVQELLAAFAKVREQHPSVFLLYVGPEEQHEQFNLGDSKNIVAVGLTDHAEYYLAASDLLCLPSYREGFGSVILEAAALKVPSIGSKIPGLVDSIQDQETGILVPARSAEDLAEAMADLYLHPRKLAALSEKALANVQANFDAKIVNEKLNDFYIGLLNRSSF